MARSSRTVLIRKHKVRTPEAGRPKGSVSPSEQQSVIARMGW